MMPVHVICDKCGETITNMHMLKSIKDTLSSHAGKCPSCGEKLSASEFDIDIQDS